MKWSNMWKLKDWTIFDYDEKKGTVTMEHTKSFLMHTNVRLPKLMVRLMTYEYSRGRNDKVKQIKKAISDIGL